jgi:hypothetical protein
VGGRREGAGVLVEEVEVGARVFVDVAEVLRERRGDDEVGHPVSVEVAAAGDRRPEAAARVARVAGEGVEELAGEARVDVRAARRRGGRGADREVLVPVEVHVADVRHRLAEPLARAGGGEHEVR